MAQKQTRETYGIYLPNDSEMWFKVTFTSAARARWFAEANDLGKSDCEIRPVSKIQKEAA